MSQPEKIESLLKEERSFPPPAKFAAAAHVRSMDEYEALYKQSIEDPCAFWASVAEQNFRWFRMWDRTLDWQLPHARWFVGAQTNLCFNCVDRHVERGLGDKTAILFEGEPGDVRRLSFRELQTEVCKFANVLKSLGVKKGDRVTIYMPMTPELAIACLACARIGAPHSVIFGGFSVQAIVDRVEDAQSHVVITSDGGWRRGKVVPLKENVDQAAAQCALIKTVVVHRRIGERMESGAAPLVDGRDHWWHELMAAESAECPPEKCDAEDMLFLLYTSGSTGKPKGILHTTAGYMVYTATTAKYIFDLKPDDIFWCTADIGWITGHSYVIYGILANGVTTVMYEGAPNHPDWERFWALIERHKVTKFYTAPTAIRAFMREGRQHADKHDLSSLKLLGTVGEPINPEAWMWYHEVVGRGRCPIVDTWWQTETGGILISPIPGATPTKPGTATRPFFGIEPAVMSKDGTVLPPNAGGLLCIKKPWPGMLRGIWRDPERFVRQYWSEIDDVYFAGDSARMDADGYFWIMGRVDDVIKVSGHRLGTMEVESAIVAHPAVAEAAVVGVPHEIKGNAIAAFVTLTADRIGDIASHDGLAKLREELMQHVTHALGAVARPDQIRFTQSLPKTRSGKIMRRLLREIAGGGQVKGDTTTLEDFSVLAKLAEKDE
ncbi:MAG: acetate--CoA ligase [Planctomycetes bacterium]|nr:acetate--CoA ligase [Planctomycetota bacterium]